MKYKVEILQLDFESKTGRDKAFMFYDWIIERYGKINLDDYIRVYTGELDTNNLDEIFNIFNTKRPKDFKGHSLSVSDIVSIDGKMYYCDSIGWKELKR